MDVKMRILFLRVKPRRCPVKSQEKSFVVVKFSL